MKRGFCCPQFSIFLKVIICLADYYSTVEKLMGSRMKTFHFLMLFVNLTRFCRKVVWPVDALVFTLVTCIPGSSIAESQSKGRLWRVSPPIVGQAWSVVGGVISNTSLFLPGSSFPHPEYVMSLGSSQLSHFFVVVLSFQKRNTRHISSGALSIKCSWLFTWFHVLTITF